MKTKILTMALITILSSIAFSKPNSKIYTDELSTTYYQDQPGRIVYSFSREWCNQTLKELNEFLKFSENGKFVIFTGGCASRYVPSGGTDIMTTYLSGSLRSNLGDGEYRSPGFCMPRNSNLSEVLHSMSTDQIVMTIDQYKGAGSCTERYEPVSIVAYVKR